MQACSHHDIFDLILSFLHFYFILYTNSYFFPSSEELGLYYIEGAKTQMISPLTVFNTFKLIIIILSDPLNLIILKAMMK